jgi:hypothetical protein
MSLSGFLPAVSRRAVVIGSLAVFACVTAGAPLRAQAQQPAPAQQADPLTFDSTSPLLVFITLTADADKAMEEALTKAKDVLAKSDKPERKAQAAHWKVLRTEQGDGHVILIYVLDQVQKGVSYNPFAILYDSGAPREQVDPLLAKINTPGAIGLSKSAYTPFIDMGGGAGGGH